MTRVLLPLHSRRVTISLSIIAAIFMTSGVLHLVKPALFMSIMPPWLPAPRALVLISGVCEMLGAIGILLQATRVSAAWGLIALLVAVFPANIQMLINAHERHMSTAWQAALVARLPLQVALIYWIHHVAIRSRR